MKRKIWIPVLLSVAILVSALCVFVGSLTYGERTVNETITVDGKLNDTGWQNADWILVNSRNGYYQENLVIDAFCFSYALRSDASNLYLGIKLQCAPHLTESPSQTGSTNVRFWFDCTPDQTEDRTGLFDISYDGKSCKVTRADIAANPVSALTSDKENTYFEIAFPLSELGYQKAKGLSVDVTVSDPVEGDGKYIALHCIQCADALPWKETSAYLRLNLDALALQKNIKIKEYTVTGETGDLDCDGLVTSFDMTVLLQYLAGKQAIPDDVLLQADLNEDKTVDEKDAALLEEYICGIHTRFMKDCSHPVISVRNLDGGAFERTCSLCGYREVVEKKGSVRIAYIPIDNRPCNYERVIYMAESAGMELLVPDEDLFRTALDNMTPNKNGTTYGDREKLLQWIQETDKICDYFVLSLDQLLSGGLVASRWMSNTDLTLEYKIADAVIDLCRNNTVVLFDTVMRLASTINYQGYEMNEYNALRTYGQKARKTLTGNQLTVENIIAGYRYDTNGNPISSTLSESTLSAYHASRARKLKLADYILRRAGDDLNFIYFGVDDSSPQTTIQTNEINYLKNLMGERGVLSAGCDELGACGVTRIAALVYGSVDINVKYYGPGENRAADSYDIGTLGSNVDIHLESMLIGKTTDENAMQFLVLTSGCTSSDRTRMYDQITYNLEHHIPTILMDNSEDKKPLANKLIYGSWNLPEIMGYSCWNTAGNMLGLSLSMGLSRCLYLRAVDESTAEADAGFLKSITFGYIKDITYKHTHTSIDGIMKGYDYCANDVLTKLNKGTIVKSLSPYKTEAHGTVSTSNYRYPWNRTFEMTFDINVK